MTTIDLNKVAYCTLFWENQSGVLKFHRPSEPSVHGIVFDANEYAWYHPSYPKETCIERARRLEILDIWEPKLVVKFTTTRRLLFKGDRALKLWESWNKKIFGKGKCL